jgi:hypothetical protein
MEVFLAKLTSGEEIIGKIVKETDDGKLIAKDVRVLMAHPGADGQMAVGMIPWMIGAPDSDIAISKSDIIGVPDGALPKQLEDSYLQQTSGIAFASASDAGIQV